MQSPAYAGNTPSHARRNRVASPCRQAYRSEEHTSELQSRLHLVCRLLLEKKTEEGCLSIPEIYGDVERPFTVTIRAMNENDEQYEATGSEHLGRCFQPVIDHLDGKLFIHY